MHLPTFHDLKDLVKLNMSNSPAEAVEAVELRVHMDCPGCERTVRKALSHLKGIHSVDIDREQQKVTVTGFVDKRKVLNRVRRKGKVAEYWPPNLPPPAEEEEEELAGGPNGELYSYDLGMTESGRPLRYVYVNGIPYRGDMYERPYVYNTRPHGPVVDAFSEDNPNNCSIM